jgi:probable rRNA maturation factor
MIEIQKYYPDYLELDTEFVEKALRLTLEHLEKFDVDLTLRLTRDPEIRQMNQTFRSLAQTTDVLAFNQDMINPETNRLYLGDIIISVDRAMQQAQEQGHSLDHEVAFLAIHGVLHLLGYDHAQPEDKKEMWGLQNEIFDNLIHNKGKEST